MQQRSASTDDPAPDQSGSAGPPGFHGDQNFAERLPWEDSDRLWRTSCLQLRSVCRREVDRDRGDGLSWKVTLVRNYVCGLVKCDWLAGRYSTLRSPEELRGRRMCPLDVHAWGEILEAELQR
ncbi:hypothetical protein CRUP_011939 [Coryphaenoides rupestris]|nr:hypothetical protein CRUP_011939 [Coryphaenoides rupestris]